ncbi:hypothetical protein [Massilia sp. TSP1-1-2]|uniref:hypothetical protein n=1 Tax=Massilia sp. TSP1-1-2 TaxID=2804649 RepID=UPI003CFB1216
MTITTRAGKGAPLTNTELDTNFTDLRDLKAPLAGPTLTGVVTITDAVTGVLLLNTTSSSTSARNFGFGQLTSYGTLDLKISAAQNGAPASGASIASFSAAAAILPARVVVGTSTDNGVDKLQVAGTVSAQDTISATKTAAGTTSEVLSLKNAGTGANTKAEVAFYAAGTKYAGITGGYGASAPEINVAVSGATVATFNSACFVSNKPIGVGVTPDPWQSGTQALQGTGGSLWFRSIANGMHLMANAYHDGAAYKYSGAAKASQYMQQDGAHYWAVNNTAGTGGTAITFNTAMTLSNTGYLGLGTSGYTLGSDLQLGRVFSLAQDINSGYLGAGWLGVAPVYAVTGNFATRMHFDSALGGMYWLNAVAGTAGAAVTFTERMRLTNTGNLLVGTASDNGVNKLQVAGSAVAYGNISINAGNDFGFTLNGGMSITRKVGDSLGFSTGSTERMQIAAAGNVLINKTAVYAGARLSVDNLNGGAATAAAGWVTGDFGGSGAAANRVVIGAYANKAIIGAHNSDLTAWASLYLNDGGGNVILGSGADNGVDKLQVNGSVKVNSDLKAVSTAIPINIIADGNGSGASGGSALVCRTTGNSTIAMGNKSALLGGAYDATPMIYGNGPISTNVSMTVGGSVYSASSLFLSSYGGNYTLENITTIPHYGITWQVLTSTAAQGAAAIVSGYGGVILGTGGAERMRMDNAGNLLVGSTSGTCHSIKKSVTTGSGILILGAGVGGDMAAFYACDSFSWNGASSGMVLGKMNSTGRSFNAAGTINASGADYAEYMVKADGVGDIAKGAVVGIDADGKVTDRWLDAVSFMVKTTNPSYVGGDTWGIGLKGDELEAARAKVDRIAYAGQVPVNVLGAKPGQFIVPVQCGAGIGGIAVANAALSLGQYLAAVGIVQNILPDGRANIRVKVA